MTMPDDWTDQELISHYGTCGTCGAPRTTRTTVTPVAWPFHTDVTAVELVCSHDDSHDTDVWPEDD